ncbi:uncharacterized protein K489DRAFT_317274, partial [Dissoconium aciculare CBS 342.82]|uniref:Uncharacterized protein n=1 Tax=Dissoconium aciculare CBS 342.82 TaxID=1314786 RepID=A0A6J3M7Z1_9PEZI
YVRPAPLPMSIAWTVTLKTIGSWMLTPFGFLVSLFTVNIIAWATMLFLLLCNFISAMCWIPNHNQGWDYDCTSMQSPRLKWIEINSQVLNALFCITGFGLAPWRLRDQYFILDYHLIAEAKHGKVRKMYGLRKLAGQYRNWIRLPGSQSLDCSKSDTRIPLPVNKQPNPPATGIRAPGTSIWKVDVVVGCQTVNTLLQGGLCGFMWGWNRFNRPPWATGSLITMAVIVTIIGGIVGYLESRNIKRIEGVSPPVDRQTMQQAIRDISKGQTSSRAQRTRAMAVV